MKKIALILSLFIFTIYLPSTANAARSGFMLKRMGSLSGQIYINDTPLPFATVSFFMEKNGLPPIEDGMRRVPEFLARTDKAGQFTAKLVAGGYYIGILMRKPGVGPGPPREGENYYFVSSNPGELHILTIKEKETIDAGRLDGAPPETFSAMADFFTVNGTVRDENGNPYPGVVVLGKSQLNIPRPEFISVRTSADGVFQLRLPTSKAFYLVARETIASARPRPGNYIGTYGIKSKTGLATPSIFSAGSPPPGVMSEDDGSRALAVSGGVGERVSGIDIFMYKVPNPETIKASIQGSTNAPKFETGAALNNIFFKYNSYVLDHESFNELDRWTSFLTGRDDLTIELHGHTDNKGSADFNRVLSQKRAQAVADYLIVGKISATRLIIKGHGPDKPVSSNESSEGRRRNRRVEIKFVPQKKR